jgi:hypothetical protein
MHDLAPEPAILHALRSHARQKKVDRISLKEIDREIAKVRKDKGTRTRLLPRI